MNMLAMTGADGGSTAGSSNAPSGDDTLNSLGPDGQELAPIREAIALWPTESSHCKGEIMQTDGKIVRCSATLEIMDFESNSSCSTKSGPQPAIIIAPGGGYRRHPEAPARGVLGLYLHQKGFKVFGLRYRNHLPEMPGPLADGMRAVRITRARSAELGVDPNKIILLGFSSGAHVAAGAATFASKSSDEMSTLLLKSLGLDICCENEGEIGAHRQSRPDVVVTACAACCLTVPMLAPALSAEPVLTFETGGRGKALFGSGEAADESRAQWSPELHVPVGAPPLFAFHSSKDDTAPIENSERLVCSFKEKSACPAELFKVDYGGHADFPIAARDAMLAFLKKVLEIE
eukprot:TRINITY_DN113371_c0_g1_i1.p1 TRINITY_DN113371_c0_g1~~TRINITY_DN113371_c0_g1_i1.p1  ORF type:complete len:347 (-),score=60.32 TRINITY_DN113371_c0_g1_i1:451-1491(-)